MWRRCRSSRKHSESRAPLPNNFFRIDPPAHTPFFWAVPTATHRKGGPLPASRYLNQGAGITLSPPRISPTDSLDLRRRRGPMQPIDFPARRRRFWPELERRLVTFSPALIEKM